MQHQIILANIQVQGLKLSIWDINWKLKQATFCKNTPKSLFGFKAQQHLFVHQTVLKTQLDQSVLQTQGLVDQKPKCRKQ